MEDTRKNPDQLLKEIQNEEQNRGRGHLKIFFGYAAGVGKTYAMLKAAHTAKRRGVDVVAGYIEPHARPETIALMNGLELLPQLNVEYKGITLHEFDIDAALKRKPQLLLVDELAHTNIEGCRHAKRYQDIKELLQAGIDVYTTVNVQHIESLCDMVASITEVVVRERIPDAVFENADQVEIVDIEPQDLIERMKAGKVYKEGQAARAMDNFFTVKNLTALREIALRKCADRVNALAESVRIKNHGEYYTDEHILVCLSQYPSNARTIRTAARMAKAFKGDFTALFVETPTSSRLSAKEEKRLRFNMHLAQQLGAKIEIVYGDDAALQIAEFSRLSAVSKIVIGRSDVSKLPFLKKSNLTDRLITNAPDIDVHVIPDGPPAGSQRRIKREKQRKDKDPKGLAADALKSVAILFIISCIGLLFSHLGFKESNIITLYVMGVLLISVFTKHRFYSLVSSVISVMIFNFLFTEPRFSFFAYDDGYPITFIVMFLAAFLTSTLALRLKKIARKSALAAYRTKVLFDTNQQLQQESEPEEIIAVTANQLKKLLNRSIIFYLNKNGAVDDPHIYAMEGKTLDERCISENERAVAQWVLKNNKHAGATTETLSNARCYYLAVRVNDRVYAVVGIEMGERPLDAFENSILLSILGECALALENERNAREKAEAALMAKNEQLRANLLRSISHDLRTPLTSISGNASNLLYNGDSFDDTTKRRLYTDIYDDSMWLISLVENLLAVTRIEEGRLNLKITEDLVEDAVEEALSHVSRESEKHIISVEHQEDFLMAKMDVRLIVQVIINIVDNAIKYTPEGSHIRIHTKKEGKEAVISIADDGEGIPDDAKGKIFDMFYSNTDKIADSKRSMGLGLYLCKAIVNAHGGEITVSDNIPHGTVFTFTLPVGEVQIHE